MHRPAPRRAQDPAQPTPPPRGPADPPTRPRIHLEALLDAQSLDDDAAGERVVLDEPTIVSDGVGALVAFTALVVLLVVFVLWVLPYLLVG